MIYVQPTLDAQVWPTTISPYNRMIHENLGDQADQHFRLWFCENAPHGAPEFIGPALTTEKDPGVWTSRLVSYDGITAQALRDIVRWTEDDVPPPAYHGFHMDRDNQLTLPEFAADRGGVQPVVAAETNGAARAEVKVGETVSFLGQGEQPAGMGSIVRAEWDFEGTGAFEPATFDPSSFVEIKAGHAYATPGTYFASFRVGAYRDGTTTGPTTDNLARVRVVVTG